MILNSFAVRPPIVVPDARAGAPVLATSLSSRFCFALPGPYTTRAGLKELVLVSRATNSSTPISRWDGTQVRGGYVSAAYGAFVSQGVFLSDAAVFGISAMEARGLDPVVLMILETSYAAFDHSLASSSSGRASFSNTPVGFFLGAGGSISSHRGDSGTRGDT